MIPNWFVIRRRMNTSEPKSHAYDCDCSDAHARSMSTMHIVCRSLCMRCCAHKFPRTQIGRRLWKSSMPHSDQLQFHCSIYIFITDSDVDFAHIKVFYWIMYETLIAKHSSNWQRGERWVARSVSACPIDSTWCNYFNYCWFSISTWRVEIDRVSIALYSNAPDSRRTQAWSNDVHLNRILYFLAFFIRFIFFFVFFLLKSLRFCLLYGNLSEWTRMIE